MDVDKPADKKNTFLKACAVLLGLLLPTLFFLNNEAIWDDQTIFDVHAHWSLPAMFGPFGISYPAAYWRPLTVISIAVPYLVGLPIWGGKLFNVALFLIQGCLAIAVVRQYRIIRPTVLPLGSLAALSALIALHPIFVETTLWIAARADLLLGVFVMLGIYWLLRSWEQEQSLVDPESYGNGLARSFIIVSLACASKDTGIVWAGCAVVVIFLHSFKSKGDWKKYWWAWCAGLCAAIINYALIRTAVLHNSTGYNQLLVRSDFSLTDRVRVFLEFVVRALIDFFLPICDLAPFKSAGWLAELNAPSLWLILLLLGGAIGFCVRWVFAKNTLSGLLSLIALALILFHAILTAFAETVQGGILATRYLAPSALLLLVALTLILVKTVAPNLPGQKNWFRLVNFPVALIFIAMLLQSLGCWTESRTSWSTNLGLWENSWTHGSRSKIVTVNYSNAELFAGNPELARDVALDWITTHQNTAPKIQLCKFYNVAIKASLLLNDQRAATQLAIDATDVAWCNMELIQNVAFLQLGSRCESVLPILNQAIIEGDKPVGVGLWQFDINESREKIVLMAAYGEARCGTDSRALERLREAARNNSQWDINGPMAQGLLKSAKE